MSESEHADHESFAEFVDERQATNRTIGVYVEGDLENDPPLGNAAAARVAHKLVSDDEEVLIIDPESAADDEVPENVGCVRITLPTNPDESEWRPVMRRLLSRVPSDVHIVVLVDTDDVPWFCKELGDVRVVATGIDDPVEFYRVRLNPYSGEVYYHEIRGFESK